MPWPNFAFAMAGGFVAVAMSVRAGPWGQPSKDDGAASPRASATTCIIGRRERPRAGRDRLPGRDRRRGARLAEEQAVPPRAADDGAAAHRLRPHPPDP